MSIAEARAIVHYTGTSKSVFLTLTQNVTGDTPLFDESSVYQWAVDNTPTGLTLDYVKYSPGYEDVTS